MMGELIECTEQTVTLCADAPRKVGTKTELAVSLPDGILLRSFSLSGTITGCRCVSHPESDYYVLEMEIGELSPMNKKILDAYKGFLERESMRMKRRVNTKAAEQAFQDFVANLRRLHNTAEETRQIMQGTLELARRAAQGKITIH
ncbi:MAG: hypothetical protein SWE60_26605 [Thermodesulfobacteriota bacterium]|nr:hypothetical protein [Thermodesulfobacteriota bacterium]